MAAGTTGENSLTEPFHVLSLLQTSKIACLSYMPHQIMVKKKSVLTKKFTKISNRIPYQLHGEEGPTRVTLSGNYGSRGERCRVGRAIHLFILLKTKIQLSIFKRSYWLYLMIHKWGSIYQIERSLDELYKMRERLS